jgi:hypothetical protein
MYIIIKLNAKSEINNRILIKSTLNYEFGSQLHLLALCARVSLLFKALGEGVRGITINIFKALSVV